MAEEPRPMSAAHPNGTGDGDPDRSADAGSYRDPGRRVFHQADQVSRVLDRGAKAAFVARVLAEDPPAIVWGVGSNDGHFSRLAAEVAEYVLAADADDVILDESYRSLKVAGIENVLPIVRDLSNPSPGIGWRGLKRPPVGDCSSPDMAFCLAVVHHLVIGRNVPLRAVIAWLADLNARVVLEFVAPDDPMARALTVNKRPHEVHPNHNGADLRPYLQDCFTIESEEDLPGDTRRLFSLRSIIRA